MGHIRINEHRLAGLALALVLFVGAPAQALQFVDAIPAGYAAGFDVPSPDPDWLMSTDMADFLTASPVLGSGAAITFSASNCFYWGGSTQCQTSAPPTGTQNYMGVATWTVEEINIPVPTDGLLLFLGGIANADYVPGPGEPTPPDYQPGSVELLTDSGLIGGSFVFALDELLLPLGPGFDYSYFGVPVFEIGDSMTFAYRVDVQLAGGTPVPYANVANNPTIVPEPGTALLVGAGLALLARRRNRS